MDSDPILYWNRCGLEFNRLTHSIRVPQGGPTMSSRALGMLQLSIHDAFFSIRPPSHNHWATYLLLATEDNAPQELPARDPDANDAVVSALVVETRISDGVTEVATGLAG
ncbi:hypothetical protein [Aureimonas sp. SA4125]|uniref:hypothetical protein n=1 Tax=Aureimonas sp. SA4125 TaxID=2826993 RepID=UPI001CC5296D|nr:hypothetical protein [Aureimonas sp. SA4125]